MFSTRIKILGSLVLLIVLVYGYSMQRLTESLAPLSKESIEESLVDTTHVLAQLIADQSSNHHIEVNAFRPSFERAALSKVEANIYEFRKRQVDLRIYITDTSGIVLYDSSGHDEGKNYSQWNDVLLTLQGKYGARSSVTEINGVRLPMLYVAAPIVKDGTLLGALSVGKSTGSAQFFAASFRQKALILTLSLGGIALALGWILAQYICSPIERLTKYAQAVRDNQRPPLPFVGRGEVAQLATAFEEMRISLEGKKYIETYVENLTHELKSPLSAIMGASEILDGNIPPAEGKMFLDNIRMEAQRMKDLVVRLLELASLENRHSSLDTSIFSLNELVEELTISLASQTTILSIQIEYIASQDISLKSDRFLLFRCMSNLLQNAIDFSSPQSVIQIRGSVSNEKVIIDIIDEGSGIPSFAASRIFERFYSLARPGSGRKSSGLGLAFVKAALASIGGTIQLSNNAAMGATATIAIPA